MTSSAPSRFHDVGNDEHTPAPISSSVKEKPNPAAQAACLAAVKEGALERVSVLLREGVAVNWQDEAGASLLFHTIFRRHFVIAEALLARGANIDLPDQRGWTPLFWAAFNDHVDIVGFLVAHHADTNVATHEGDRPLFMAAYKGHVEVVRLLLAGGAQWDAVDPDGRDALWVAGMMVTLSLDRRCWDDAYGKPPRFFDAKQSRNQAICGSYLVAIIKGTERVLVAGHAKHINDVCHGDWPLIISSQPGCRCQAIICRNPAPARCGVEKRNETDTQKPPVISVIETALSCP